MKHFFVPLALSSSSLLSADKLCVFALNAANYFIIFWPNSYFEASNFDSTFFAMFV